MADDKKLIEFQHEARGAVFEAALESDAHPEPSYFQWVTGLPEALRTPGAWFATTKKMRHPWAARPGAPTLRWCPVCGVYEDTKMLRRETLRTVELCNKTVYRPMGKPTTFYEKMPACVAPPEGTPVEPPPPYADELMATVEAMGKGSAP